MDCLLEGLKSVCIVSLVLFPRNFSPLIASCRLISILVLIESEDLIVVGNHSFLLMSKVRIDMEIGLELMEEIGNNYLIGD